MLAHILLVHLAGFFNAVIWANVNKPNILFQSDVTVLYFLLIQSADFFRDDNPEGIEARNEVSTLY